jgi:hypothetical protein
MPPKTLLPGPSFSRKRQSANAENLQIPAECFPTRFRCTLYGIAAAWGKLGAVLVQLVILANGEISKPDSPAIQFLLAGFAACMALGAVFSHYFVPRVQKQSGYGDIRKDWRGRDVRAPPYVNVPLERLPLAVRRRRAGVGAADSDHEMDALRMNDSLA